MSLILLVRKKTYVQQMPLLLRSIMKYDRNLLFYALADVRYNLICQSALRKCKKELLATCSCNFCKVFVSRFADFNGFKLFSIRGKMMASCFITLKWNLSRVKKKKCWRHGRRGIKDAVTTVQNPYYWKVWRWGQGKWKIIKNCVTSFMDDPLPEKLFLCYLRPKFRLDRY